MLGKTSSTSFVEEGIGKTRHTKRSLNRAGAQQRVCSGGAGQGLGRTKTEPSQRRGGWGASSQTGARPVKWAQVPRESLRESVAFAVATGCVHA